MEKKPVSLVIGKLIVSAAWADGEIQPEEESCLKDLVFQLPDIGDSEWEELSQLMQEPISAEQLKAFSDEFTELVTSEEDKYLALYALSRVVNADGIVTESEKDFIRDMKQVLFGSDELRIKRMDGLLKHSLYLRDKIHIETKIEVTLNDASQDIASKKLNLAAFLMARIAYVDQSEDDNFEIVMVKDSLIDTWGLAEDQAEYVTQVAFSCKPKNMDIIRVCREFYEETTEEERVKFLDILLNVSFADGVLTDDELHEVINIIANLKLGHQDFQNALNRFELEVPVLS